MLRFSKSTWAALLGVALVVPAVPASAQVNAPKAQVEGNTQVEAQAPRAPRADAPRGEAPRAGANADVDANVDAPRAGANADANVDANAPNRPAARAGANVDVNAQGRPGARAGANVDVNAQGQPGARVGAGAGVRRGAGVGAAIGAGVAAGVNQVRRAEIRAERRAARAAAAARTPIVVMQALPQPVVVELRKVPVVEAVVHESQKSEFKTFAKAVAAAGLEETLRGPGPITVFAPTDAAFAQLPAGELDALLQDKAALKELLLNHVVEGQITTAQANEPLEVRAESGLDIELARSESYVFVNDAAIVRPDIATSNGVLQGIDRVLIAYTEPAAEEAAPARATPAPAGVDPANPDGVRTNPPRRGPSLNIEVNTPAPR
ncbi:MAG TPA: fasciclin domain-containing protein [Pirellulales bacterium]